MSAVSAVPGSPSPASSPSPPSSVPPSLQPVAGESIDVLASADAERSRARKENWRLLRRRPSFLIGVFISLFWIVCALIGKQIAPQDAFKPGKPTLRPSAAHWFGTDKIGRDIFARVIVGARDVLMISPAAALLGVVIGTILGMVMGYKRGITDMVLSRVVEALLALPLILVALLMLTLGQDSPFLKSITFQSQRVLVLYVVAFLFAPIVARTVRSAVIGERELDYVTSAKLRGESDFFVMTREILPNVMAPIIVELTVRIGYAIFTVATLSFLGVGIPRPAPDWGLMISDGSDLLRAGLWWLVTFPALAIASLVIAVNLIADSIQAVFDR
jgi:peptide/nickel transport system permease protein